MDIYSYIKREHQILRNLMEKICVCDDTNERSKLYATLREELTLHAVTKEVTFYQVLMENGGGHLENQIKHSELAHDDIEHFLRVLDITDVKLDKWLILFGQLKHCVERHMEKEEGETFEASQRVLSDAQSLALAVSMERLKQQKIFSEAA